LKESEYVTHLKALAEKRQSNDEIYDLVRYYYDQQMWTEYQEWYEIYHDFRKKNGQPLNEYVESLHAVALMRQGLLEEARRYFAKIIPMDRSHRFVGHWLALELFAGTPINEVEELSKQYPERGWRGSSDWSRLINSMEKEQLNTQAAKEYLQIGLKYHIKGESENLKEYVDKEDIDIKNIRGQKAFLKALLEVR
jgi:tetratricopeptide (TPR) repeat protein